MNGLVSSLIVGFFFAFITYWYIKFKYLLPVEKKINTIDGIYSKFQDFSREAVKHNYIPVNAEQFNEVVGQSLVRMKGFFPDISVFVFEKNEERWDMSFYLKEGELLFDGKMAFLSGILNKCLNENDLMHIAGFGEQLDISLFRDAALMPFISFDGKIKQVIFIGIPPSTEFKIMLPYLKHILLNVNYSYRLYEKVISLREENSRLKNELDVLVKELDMAGSRLIQKAKERKALYEVVTKITDENDNKDGVSAIINILARITEADFAGFLVYDEAKKVLSPHGAAYGLKEEDVKVFSISIENSASASVRAFLSKKPFLTGEASREPAILKGYVDFLGAESLVIVPVFMQENMIGVLEAGSRKKNFFTEEHLEFLTMIADELAMVIGTINLYSKISSTAEELAQMNKMKDEFLSTVSHELKTPLTTIKGFISVLLSGEVGSLTDQQISFLNIIDQASNRLNSLISNLLDISRLNGKVDMEFSPVDLREVIRNSVGSFLIKAKEKNILLSFNSDKNIPYVFGDPHWLRQVSDNLIVNSIKYSSDKKKVEVTVLDQGDVITVCVADQGMGIPKDEQKKVFEKFYRGKNSLLNTQGTGLGLAISKSIVEKHGGKIWVESEPGVGSRFYFALPKMKERA